MELTKLFNANSVAVQWTDSSANESYLGASLFTPKKKMGLDLSYIRGHKGLAASLMPSNFDAKSTLRTRESVKSFQGQMAFFRESMLVSEKDEQEMLRIQESGDPYAQEVLDRIYDDVNVLLAGANVVPERMRMQLLCPDIDGSPRILINANGVQYAYNYDPDGGYKANNYKAISGTSAWSDHENADPIADLQAAKTALKALNGSAPARVLMNSVTLGHMKANKNVRAYVLAQNVSANVLMNDTRIKELISSELGLQLIVDDDLFHDESGASQKFYKDGFVTLLPDGALGSTWYGVTPEERTLQGSGEANVSIVNTGVAVAVKIIEDPVNTKTTVSEIVLPSYERMDETYVLKVLE